MIDKCELCFAELGKNKYSDLGYIVCDKCFYKNSADIMKTIKTRFTFEGGGDKTPDDYIVNYIKHPTK